MRNTVVRVVGTFAFPHAEYVSSVGRDGGFAIARDKNKARRFVPKTAREVIARLSTSMTKMQFDTCEVAP